MQLKYLIHILISAAMWWVPFRAYGELCATHPWEVIVTTLTAAACALTIDREPRDHAKPVCGGWADACPGHETEYHAADAVLMTFIRCLAILYTYYKFSNLLKLGSKNILGECFCIGMGVCLMMMRGEKCSDVVELSMTSICCS